ncbi:MAG: hypothetical protein H6636_04350 [Anaerolineales bacterium]|nr:hypothetical protein [Anaerolineales bacterium]
MATSTSTPIPAPKKKRTASHTSKSAQVPLPFLVEFVYTLARLTVLFAGVITLSLSLLAHATPWVAVFRSSLAMIVTGLLAWMLVSIVGQTALDVAKAKRAEEDEEEAKKAEEEKAKKAKEAEEAESTVEKEA